MSTGTVMLIVLALVVIAVVAGLASTLTHRQATGRRAGPEFGRLVRETGRRRARAEFAARRRRVDGLGIKPLTADQRSWYTDQWAAAQEQFIDSPAEATQTAAALVATVAATRGYEVSDADQLLTDLSVYHGQYLDGYRRAMRTTRETAAGTVAGTEELRQALLDHRALFRDLLEAAPAPAAGQRPAAAADRTWRLPRWPAASSRSGPAPGDTSAIAIREDDTRR